MTNYEPITPEELTEEEKQEMHTTILENENDMIRGLLDAANDVDALTREIAIVRNGRTFFKFSVHPLTEDELNQIRKKYTKYAKNKRQGIKVAEEIDNAKYRASIIYNSTIPSDREKLWSNKQVWNQLERTGKFIINELDVIAAVLLPGEVDQIMDVIDDLNGFNGDELRSTAKN